MVEQQRQRVEQEMTKMINEIDRTFLRKMQVREVRKYCFSYLMEFLIRVTCICALRGVATVRICRWSRCSSAWSVVRRR